MGKLSIKKVPLFLVLTIPLWLDNLPFNLLTPTVHNSTGNWSRNNNFSLIWHTLQHSNLKSLWLMYYVPQRTCTIDYEYTLAVQWNSNLGIINNRTITQPKCNFIFFSGHKPDGPIQKETPYTAHVAEDKRLATHGLFLLVLQWTS